VKLIALKNTTYFTTLTLHHFNILKSITKLQNPVDPMSEKKKKTCLGIICPLFSMPRIGVSLC